ncbi:hypothetical protein D9981_01190 [Pseudoalteromonas phenolica O-BC30]|nr:hypothetical protein D9981_01190 [Pseudoalteromonas phenolica O-BC30]
MLARFLILIKLKYTFECGFVFNQTSNGFFFFYLLFFLSAAMAAWLANVSASARDRAVFFHKYAC